MSEKIDLRDFLLKLNGTTKTENGVLMEKEGFKISAELTNSQEISGTFIVMVAFKAEHDGILPEAVTDFTAGAGKTQGDAVADAMKVWSEGVLSVLLHLNDSNYDSGIVRQIELTTLSEVGEPVVWDLFRGGLQGTGSEATEGLKGTTHDDRMLQVMINDITGELHRNSLICIKSVIARNGDKVSGNSIINNQPWDSGFDSLCKWAESWGHCEEPQVRRQFVVCRPTDKTPNPEAVENLKKQLAEIKAKQKEETTN